MKKPKINFRKVLISLIVGTGIIALVFLYFNFRNKSISELKLTDKIEEVGDIKQADEVGEICKYINREVSWVDFDGDGYSELVLAFSKDEFYLKKDFDFNGYIAVFDRDDNEIARTPEGFTPVYSTLPGHMEAYKFDSSSKKEYLRLRIIAGSHHFDNLFLTLIGDKLLPVCREKVPDKFDDCVFYNTVDELIIEDLDDDGLTEVVEMVDEYPPTGGRGRPVVWEIYRFNGDYLEPQEGESYDKLFSLVAKRYEKYTPIIKKAELSEESIENFEMVKSFWRGDIE